jgi:hypothetical protein
MAIIAIVIDCSGIRNCLITPNIRMSDADDEKLLKPGINPNDTLAKGKLDKHRK